MGNLRAIGRWTAGLLVCVGLLLYAGPSADLHGQDASALFNTAKSAVANKGIDKTSLAGPSTAKPSFSETSDQGAVLIGFELGLAKGPKGGEVIHTVRPIYLTPKGEAPSYEYGPPADSGPKGTAKTAVKSAVTRKVRIKAKPGYAVGAVTVRTGTDLHGMNVTFMRIAGARLHPKDTYTSEWVGDRSTGQEEFLGGNGYPVVGVFGSEGDGRVLALGLTYVKDPSAPAKPSTNPALTKQPSDGSGKTDAEAGVKPATKPEKADASGETSKAEGGDKTKEPDAEEPEEESTPASQGLSWVPFAIGGAVALPLFLLLLVCFGWKGRSQESAPDPFDGRGRAGGMGYARAQETDYVDYSGKAIGSLVIGMFALVGWCVPCIGVPLTIWGLKMGSQGLRSRLSVVAMIGMGLNGFCLVLAIGNFLMGVYMISTGKNPFAPQPPPYRSSAPIVAPALAGEWSGGPGAAA